MTLIQNIMNKIGFKTDSSSDVCGCDVQIKDGCVVGVPYAELSGKKVGLTQNELIAAYQKVSCVGSSIDLISNNMQMVEPIFWNNLNRDVIEYPDNDKKLKNFRRILEKPNAFMNRKTFIDMCVKEYVVHGSIWFAFIMDGKNIISIKPISSNLISLFEDVEGNRIGSLMVTNAGNYSGTYFFDGRYYTKEDDKRFVIAPLINSSTAVSYLPASLLVGTGVEVLLYWYGCFHNKSLLQNGARPSLIFLIKSMLNPKHKEQLKEEIRIRHGGAGNAGNAMIIDGSADKDVRLVSQNNKDMEFSSVLQAAEDAVYKRLGTNWVLGRNVSSKDLSLGMEMLYDMTICPLFQLFYNHLFDVFKYYNNGYEDYIIYYLEQDIPALRNRFMSMMKNMPALGIFTVAERRKMYNYAPLGDYRDNELTVESVKVTQTGASGENTTSFTTKDQEQS